MNEDLTLGDIINKNDDFNSGLIEILTYHEFENKFKSFVTVEYYKSRLSYCLTKYWDDFNFEFSTDLHTVLLLKMSTVFKILKTIEFDYNFFKV